MSRPMTLAVALACVLAGAACQSSAPNPAPGTDKAPKDPA
jgi:hypothetical protein